MANSATEITKEDFLAYRSIQESGLFNMIQLDLVSAAAGMSKEKCFEIMNNYSELYKKYIIDEGKA